MGRVNYGKKLWDQKGITGGVYVGQRCHFGWEMRAITCDNLSGLCYGEASPVQGEPAFYQGHFQVDTPADTWVRLDGFKKGIVLVNGFNLGRYWNEAGPQKTLYLPGPLLKQGENELVVLELDGTDRLEVTLTDTPDLG